MENPLTTKQIQLVQESFALVAPIADTAAGLFYQRLFVLDQRLKTLFRGDMIEQGKKLMAMIGAAIRGLDDVEKLIPAVQALGSRHAGYGVAPKDYDTVGAALLWTLEQGLGAAFTPPVKEAWTAVYGVLAATMLGASQSGVRAAA